MIFHACRFQGLTLVEIPPGCRQAGTQLIRVKSPFDFIVSAPRGLVAFLDAKTVIAKTFSFSSLTDHQVATLASLEAHSHVAGYLVCFRSQDIVSFFKASKLQSLVGKKSLTPEDGLILGKENRFEMIKIFGAP